MRRFVATFGVFLVLAISVRAWQDASKIGVYRISDSSMYHIAACPTGKGREMRSITLEQALADKLDPCFVCHPERTEPIASYLFALKARGKPFNRLRESQVRTAADLAAVAAKNNAEQFENSFLEVVQGMAWDYGGLQLVHRSDALIIAVLGPVVKFEMAAKQRVRKFEPLTGLPWDPTVSVVVEPGQIDAPDIDKIIVQRNGTIVQPLRSDLTPKVLETRLGAKRAIHSGAVMFSLDTFAPGVDVELTITAIPASGSNIVKRFTGHDLRRIH